MLLSILSDWPTTISLIFGGCCSNAITLEQLTSQYPQAGSLITFFQFLIISLHGLPKHITWTRYGPRFKPRKIPLMPYLIQVSLFYLVSLLNNAAFAYRIPMAVHIIFRSGGLIISLLLGWLVAGKRYTVTQVLSVLLVTLGVVLTTLSASQPQTPTASTTTNAYTYATGIAILTVALLFSGFLGLVQDWTYTRYGRPLPPDSSKPRPAPETPSSPHDGNASPKTKSGAGSSPAWQESMFYLHFLALPMFFLVRTDLSAQFRSVNSSPRASLSLPIPLTLSTFLTSFLPSFPYTSPSPSPSRFLSLTPTTSAPPPTPASPPLSLSLSLPTAYLPLLINTLTQLLCVAGVHRLTTRVSALTVTLVLVVRKAVSLVLSIVGVGIARADAGGAQAVDKAMMWAGAAIVLAGTVGYSLGSGKRNVKPSGGKENGKEE